MGFPSLLLRLTAFLFALLRVLLQRVTQLLIGTAARLYVAVGSEGLAPEHCACALAAVFTRHSKRLCGWILLLGNRRAQSAPPQPALQPARVVHVTYEPKVCLFDLRFLVFLYVFCESTIVKSEASGEGLGPWRMAAAGDD